MDLKWNLSMWENMMNIAIILVTHNRHGASLLGDRMMYMEFGKITDMAYPYTINRNP